MVWKWTEGMRRRTILALRSGPVIAAFNGLGAEERRRGSRSGHRWWSRLWSQGQ